MEATQSVFQKTIEFTKNYLVSPEFIVDVILKSIGESIVIIAIFALFILFIYIFGQTVNFFCCALNVLEKIKAELEKSNNINSQILQIYRNKGEPCFDEFLRKTDEETCQKEAKKKPLIIT